MWCDDDTIWEEIKEGQYTQEWGVLAFLLSCVFFLNLP